MALNWLADTVLVAHALVVVFIVGGLLAIWVGAHRRWQWIRNRTFRLLHMATIGYVALTSLMGWVCPLTLWEDWLRTGKTAQQGFIQRWVGNLLYYDFPLWVFTIAYVAFALLVVLTWKLVPPLARLGCKNLKH